MTHTSNDFVALAPSDMTDAQILAELAMLGDRYPERTALLRVEAAKRGLVCSPP